jgi:hypothetical protein
VTFALALARHTWLLMTLRHSGWGLPKSWVLCLLMVAASCWANIAFFPKFAALNPEHVVVFFAVMLAGYGRRTTFVFSLVSFVAAFVAGFLGQDLDFIANFWGWLAMLVFAFRVLFSEAPL